MRVRELLFEGTGDPLIVSMLHKLMQKRVPVMYVAQQDGQLVLRELHFVSNELSKFNDTAPKGIAGTSFTPIYFKAPGYYSWETRENGKGRGNGTFGLPHVKADEYHIAKLPSVQGRTDFVFGLKTDVKRWEKEHEGS